MPTQIENGWLIFCILFGGMLLISFLMSLLGRNFYTMDVVIRKFNIMDLEIPATATELKNLIAGLFALPEERSKKSIRSLRGQLYLDFLFMPFAYGSIILACLLLSAKMDFAAGRNVFIALAWLQFLSWLLDIIENFYLLGKIRKDVTESTTAVHNTYLLMEVVKWGIALTGAVTAIAALCYFWLSGHYIAHSLQYLLIIVGELVVFVVLGKLVKPAAASTPQ